MKSSFVVIALLMSFSALAQSVEKDMPAVPDQELQGLMKECKIMDEEAVSALESNYQLALFNSANPRLNHEQVFAAVAVQSPSAPREQVMNQFAVSDKVADAILMNARESSAVNFTNLRGIKDCWHKLSAKSDRDAQAVEQLY